MMKFLLIRHLMYKSVSWSRYAQLYKQYCTKMVDFYLPELEEKYKEKARKTLENLNGDLKRRRQRIESEIEEYRLKGFHVPESISEENLLQLISHPSDIHGRILRLKSLAEKEKTLLQLDHDQKFINNTDIKTGAVGGLEPSDTWLDVLDRYGYGCHRALTFGMPLIFDLGFDISLLEQKKTCLRLLNCYIQNMEHFNPYHLIFSGYEQSYFGDAVEMYGLNNRLHASFFKDVFSKPFNKDDFVYLSPSGEYLVDYEPNKTYVIGAYVDIYGREDLTASRARKLGIKLQQFPLMQYGKLKQNLGLNTVMDIMLEVSMQTCWDKALYKSLVCKDRSQELTKADGSLSRQKWLTGYHKIRENNLEKNKNYLSEIEIYREVFFENHK